MKKKLAALALGSLMLCSLGVPAMAADTTPLPDSELYYGEVVERRTGKDGALTALLLKSPKGGEYVMNLSDQTVWIDSGRQTASDPATLQAGERIYVYHSSVTALSLPPQSPAFAVVRNVPEDASCARYIKVEAIEEQEGTLRVTTDNGGMYLFIDSQTPLSAYGTDAPAALSDIRAGDHIMAWYDIVALSYPGQARPVHVMVLEGPGNVAPLTRAAFASLLHAAEGSPAVDYAMGFSDVPQDAPYAEAIRWAASEKLLTGYADNRFCPDDLLTREQLSVVLWRRSGSPMLMDYPGLTSYSDTGEIARFAQPALSWAHQRGLLPAGDRLGPKDTVTSAEAEAMLAALDK